MTITAETLVWDDILFDNDCIKIKPGRIKKILGAIAFKGAMPSLNAIKTEYFEKQYNKPFKLSFIDSRFSAIHSPAWMDICQLIEKAIEINRFTQVPKTLKKPSPVQKKEQKTTKSFEKVEQEKPNYLKILALFQSPQYKLITIIEKYQGKAEESHLYRFETGSKRVLIVWENTNASRATYLFIASLENMQEQLVKIEAFINTDNILFKRSRFRKLKENKQLRADLLFVGSVHHENIQQYKTDITTFINRY